MADKKGYTLKSLHVEYDSDKEEVFGLAKRNVNPGGWSDGYEREFLCIGATDKTLAMQTEDGKIAAVLSKSRKNFSKQIHLGDRCMLVWHMTRKGGLWKLKSGTVRRSKKQVTNIIGA